MSSDNQKIRRLNLTDILKESHNLSQDSHQSLEGSKLGTYRAGSTGLYNSSSDLVYGKCARTTLLRSKGIDASEISDDRHIMFSGGLMNEDILVKALDSMRDKEGFSIKREEEIPTSWQTKALGTKVTGRPDVVLIDNETGKPFLGLELKMVSSLWTARDVMAERRPKFDHLCQAAHYMWQLDVPFKLVYTSYVDFPIIGWSGKVFPKSGDTGSENIEYKVNKKTGQKDPMKVFPFRMIYDLKFSSEGTLLYKEEKSLTYERSIITVKQIEDYFELLDSVKVGGGKIPSRPLTVYPDGTPQNWSICSYCPLAEVCDNFEEEGLDQWLDKVNMFLGRGDTKS